MIIDDNYTRTILTSQLDYYKKLFGGTVELVNAILSKIVLLNMTSFCFLFFPWTSSLATKLLFSRMLPQHHI